MMMMSGPPFHLATPFTLYISYTFFLFMMNIIYTILQKSSVYKYGAVPQDHNFAHPRHPLPPVIKFDHMAYLYSTLPPLDLDKYIGPLQTTQSCTWKVFL